MSNPKSDPEPDPWALTPVVFSQTTGAAARGPVRIAGRGVHGGDRAGAAQRPPGRAPRHLHQHRRASGRSGAHFRSLLSWPEPALALCVLFHPRFESISACLHLLCCCREPVSRAVRSLCTEPRVRRSYAALMRGKGGESTRQPCRAPDVPVSGLRRKTDRGHANCSMEGSRWSTWARWRRPGRRRRRGCPTSMRCDGCVGTANAVHG